MVKTKRLKYPYLWFQSVSISSACNCYGGAMCVIGKRPKLHDKYFVYWFILYRILSSQGFCLRQVQFRCLDIRTFTHSLVSSPLIYGNITSSGYITSSQRDQLPVGLIAQLVEYCARQYRRGRGF